MESLLGNSIEIKIREGLPPTLHAKLKGRLPSLPGVVSLSVSELGQWAVVFEDGGLATSIHVEGKLGQALQENTAELKLLVLAPVNHFKY